MSVVTTIPWRPTIGFDTRLRLVRTNAGVRDRGSRYTQDEFAAMLDVKVGTYKAWEAGGEPEDIVDIAKRIERVTGVPAAWTLGVDPTETGPDDPAEQVSNTFPWKSDVANLSDYRTANDLSEAA